MIQQKDYFSILICILKLYLKATQLNCELSASVSVQAKLIALGFTKNNAHQIQPFISLNDVNPESFIHVLFRKRKNKKQPESL